MAQATFNTLNVVKYDLDHLSHVILQGILYLI